MSRITPDSKFPIDEERPLDPTRCLYLLDKADIRFVDLSTSTIAKTLPPEGDRPHTTKSLHLQADIHITAKKEATDGPTTLHLNPKPSGVTSFLTRNRTHYIATTPDNDAPVGELLSGGLWSLGQWSLTFPAGSPHCSHEIKLRPVGVGARADWFVKDSIPYYWDMVHVGLGGGRTVYKLFKAVDGKRVEVGRFEMLKARDRSGMLWLDDREVDEVVACLTAVATINRVESFRA